MQPVRMLVAVVAAAILAGCSFGGSSTKNDDGSSTTAVASGPATIASTLDMPSIPAAKWGGSGQLCQVVNPAQAGEILGHTVDAVYDTNQLPVNNGLDACTYSDATSAGFAANVVVMKGDDALWEATREDFTSRGYTIQDYTVEGADRAMLASQRGGLSQQAVVMVDGRMALANNASSGKWESDRLVQLTALAAKVAGT